MDGQLKKEFDFFLSQRDKLVKEYRGKFVVVRDLQVQGAYDDELTAIKEAQKQFKLGTFIVQRVTDAPDSVQQTFHSRVSFG